MVCDDDRLQLIGDLDAFRQFVEAGGWMTWDRLGEHRKIPNGVLRDVLRLYEQAHPEHQRSGVAHVHPEEATGIMFWEQTVPLTGPGRPA